jgi:hypothetical protein
METPTSPPLHVSGLRVCDHTSERASCRFNPALSGTDLCGCVFEIANSFRKYLFAFAPTLSDTLACRLKHNPRAFAVRVDANGHELNGATGISTRRETRPIQMNWTSCRRAPAISGTLQVARTAELADRARHAVRQEA